MRILILDTSTERGIAAFLENEQLLDEKELPFGLQNAQLLLPELQQRILKLKWQWSSLDLIGVAVGPGSYTGIRIGSMVAKTLSFACKIPLVGICTLDGFIPKHDGVFAAVIDAKIGGVYLQISRMRNGIVTPLFAPQICPLAKAVELLKECPILVSPNSAQLEAKFSALSYGCQWSWEEHYPSPVRLSAVAIENWKKGGGSIDGKLELLYMRKTQAEIEKAAKKPDCPS
jgi:tRNA threonylcarbamoyladenosine biosynthesis protein TsaB